MGGSGRLLRTERRRRPLSPAWKKWAALAACCALALGLGLWRLSAPGETGSGACVPPAVSSPPEDSSSHSGENRESGFQVEGSETTGTAFLPAIPYIHYPDVGDRPAADTSPSRMMLAGSYSVELTKEDVQKIFWGPEGKPEGADGDLPWMLFWGGFTLSRSGDHPRQRHPRHRLEPQGGPQRRRRSGRPVRQRVHGRGGGGAL